MNKLPCNDCGALILPVTAERYQGQCAPCYKTAHSEPEVPPGKSAYYFAAALLLANAGFSAFFALSEDGASVNVISIFIDIALGVKLISLSDSARFFAILRAVLGFVVSVGFQFMESASTGIILLTAIPQLVVCIALVTLLVGRTSFIRLFLGGFLSFLYLSYLAWAAYLSIYA